MRGQLNANNYPTLVTKYEPTEFNEYISYSKIFYIGLLVGKTFYIFINYFTNIILYKAFILAT